MLRTYTLYAHHAVHGRLFEPFLGETDEDAFARAQELVAGDDAIHLVEVQCPLSAKSSRNLTIVSYSREPRLHSAHNVRTTPKHTLVTRDAVARSAGRFRTRR